jgi:cyclic beta-1,2-glucan synthetase
MADGTNEPDLGPASSAPAISGFQPQIRPARTRARVVTRSLEVLVTSLAHQPNAGIPTGVEWVLDNHFLLRRAMLMARRGFNRGFEGRLPIVETGVHAGMRRVEVEAFSILRESEGLLDRAQLVGRASQFGEEIDASLAELWALPLYLRLGLLEQLLLDLPRLLESEIEPAIDHRVSNCLRSCLLIEKIDWARFVERTSAVQRILAQDPSGHFVNMDFATRDRYRRSVEALARGCGRSEKAVATVAIELATAGGPDEMAEHVGWYLLGEGRAQLETTIEARAGLVGRVSSWAKRYAGALYLSAIASVAALHLVALAVLAGAGKVTPMLVVAACLLGTIPALTIAVSLINWVVGQWVVPAPLPKLEFTAGIPDEHRTLIVVPGLLIRPSDADALARRLEAHFLATRDPNIEVAMLVDLRDADRETLPDDDQMLARARARVDALNERYGSADRGPFHLLHRRRVFCARQGVWMGWERKRGKLEELNRLLRGASDTTYVDEDGGFDRLNYFRYVLTLDADTVLPLGAGERLIETLAHPLNRARLDAAGRVRSGYTVLQPRAEIAPKDARTRFARIFAGDGAYDIYTRAVSDVYQDLLGEGIFVGKGIYAIDDFQRSLADRMPEDRVLSHDLIEGLHGRAGLVSDVVVYEDYPSNWLAYARRLHRWIRGDWQLLVWLGPWVPVAGGGHRRNPLGAIARWKILDNLRRSLLMPSLVALAVFAWLLLPHAAWIWTGLIALILATPLVADVAGTMLSGARPGGLRSAIAGVLNSTPTALWRWLLRTSFMLHEATVCLDAMTRAIIRTTITKRKQLEWTPAALASRGTNSPKTILVEMATSLALPPMFSLLLLWLRPSAMVGALPLLMLWMLAPALASWTARASRERARARERAQIDHIPLRRLARRTWAYFETVVGPSDHWLPPDNLQEQPKRVLAHRTSPTNIAMAMLSTLAAHDLGYIDLLELVFRLRNTLDTLDKLPRHRGHLLNWIDTRTLVPLEPRYVSTVDSGNFAAVLLVLEQGCRELAQEARPLRARFQGLLDSFDMLSDALTRWGPTAGESCRQVDAMRERILDSIEEPLTWPACLAELDNGGCAELDRQLIRLFQNQSGPPERFEELRTWATRLRAEIAGVRSVLAAQLPWLEILARAPEQAPVGPLCALLREVPALGQFDAVIERARSELDRLPQGENWQTWKRELDQALRSAGEHAALCQTRLLGIADLAAEFVASMDFAFLYDPQRELSYIGYDVSAERYDDHHYDLLASEARLSSLIGIAKGDIPLRHWSKLGRPIGRFGGGRGLLSWSGTMFEYLMPPLLVDEGRNTLLDNSARAAIQAQIAYARTRKVPWGISESGYARLDAQQIYQYRAFGVPTTGFRRGLDRDLVVAPYACVLALNHEPAAVVANLQALTAAGALGTLGFHEALDYTRERIGLGRDHEVVQSYMSHHQGMIMLALHGYLCERGMIRRMHRNPNIRVVELLLRERAPGRIPLEQPQPAEEGPPVRGRPTNVEGWPASTSVGVDAHAISNGNQGLLIRRGGGGHSWWRNIAITRRCLDPTFEDVGTIIYLRDEDDGEMWSTLAEPSTPGREVMFLPHGAKFVIHHHELLAELTITVAPREDAEIRLLRITNRSGRRRRLSLTHYAELVLGNALEFERHPAFAKLFVETQVVHTPHPIILCHRRPRSPGEHQPWLACLLVSHTVKWTEWETDRERFIGRGHSLRQPSERTQPLPHYDTPMQATLDTCVAMTGHVEIGPGRSSECAFISVYGSSREQVLQRARGLANLAAAKRALLDAERDAIERARGRGHETADLHWRQRLLSALLFPRLESASSPVLEAAGLGQPALWRHGISGDWPILLLRVGELGEFGAAMVVRMANAHTSWHERGIVVDLVVLEERPSGYDGALRQRIAQLLEHSGARLSAPGGGVFVVHAPELAPAERMLFMRRANLILSSEADLERVLKPPAGVPPLPPLEPEGQARPPSESLARPRDLLFDNGFGGFSADGREYVIHLEPDHHTPAPWVNVIANPGFGCVVSERGICYAWSVNAGLRRLTPWSNDSVLDPPSISLYLRDELDGAVWSPMPGPTPYPSPYQVRHGAGYSTFTLHAHALRQEVEVFVAPNDPVGVIRMTLENTWDRPRRLTATLCIEWLLGTLGSDARTIISDFVSEHEILLANNAWNPTFAERWAFVAASVPLHGLTTSREQFFGSGGDRRLPAALRRIGLSGDLVHGGDPCAALQVHIDIPAHGRSELHFVFGDGPNRESAIELAARYRRPEPVAEARYEREQLWSRLLFKTQVETPDRGFDLLVNQWLLYQTIAARLWGRTGFYQSSGAFGFRDQLQDVMAVVDTAPELVRAHLLDAAARQFSEGDVLHWWHPPSGQGLRSRCSDDLFWLPFVTAHYVQATGDQSVLHEQIPMLTAAPLTAEQHEVYLTEIAVGPTVALYEHCMRVFARATAVGVHGLPLIGSCDWNDGFSHVGRKGRGESVWMGWFLRVCALGFAPICERLGRVDDARSLRELAERLVEPLEQAWDGKWYLRAFHDDGSTLGSSSNDECRIDSLAQSWAVLCNGESERGREAMESVWQELVLRSEHVVRLFTPPFRRARARVGYVEGYPPGVRENGGQYTHAGAWVAWAMADLGDVDRAWSVAQMISPLAHGLHPRDIQRYRVEPYVIVADIYSEAPHVGRGGWSWYTGAAGWWYRFAVERLLGVRRIDGRITLAPTLPGEWPWCRLTLRDGDGVYRVQVDKQLLGRKVVECRVDGTVVGVPIVLEAGGVGEHEIVILLD